MELVAHPAGSRKEVMMKTLKYAWLSVALLTLAACGQMGTPVAEVTPEDELAPLAVAVADSTSTRECFRNINPRNTVTCVTTTVTQETKFVERTITEFVERTVTDNVVTTATEFVERPTTGPCQVGNSDRVGVAEGISTDEVLVTTTETFEVMLRDEFLVTLQDEILVTTTTVTTEVFQGNVNGRLLSTVTSNPQVTEKLEGTTEVDRVLQGTTEVSRKLVSTDVQREVLSTTFTPTSKCRNIPGPQA